MDSLRRHVLMSREEFIKEAVGIVSRARDRGIVLRILGATAIYIHSLHCEDAMLTYSRLGRLEDNKETIFTDLDLIGYSSQKKEIAKFFELELKFKFHPQMKVLLGGGRFIYFHPEDYYHVDIFFDKLDYSHTIYFGNSPNKGRLELDFPTISLADLVLEKLQIHDITRKDLIDLIVLFASHEVSESEAPEKIDGGYIAKILSDDWGFWYDATQNLIVLERFILSINDAELVPILRKVQVNIDKLKKLINEHPKTRNWEKRAKIGTRKPWYKKVDNI